MKAIFFFFFFLLISSKPIPSSSTRINYNRRILHQPFFPINSHPPTSQVQPPLSSPPPQQQPKYPFSSLSPPNNKKNPFFPLYPNSPPQPSSTTTATTTLPTFPANISSLILPPSASSSKPISKKLVAVAVCLSLLSAALISGVAAALLHHRRHPTFKESRTDSLRLFPPNTTTSDGGHKPPGSTPAWSVSGNSSEFLYLGTLRGLDEDIHQVSNSSNAGASSGYQKLGSPELHPLPPLPPRHSFRQSYRNYQVGSRDYYEQEEEEEFFSPRGSSGCKDQSPDSISQRGFHGVEAQNSRTASYLSSNSASPIHSLNLSPRSLRSKSPDSLAGFPPPFRSPPAIPLPPPPPPPKFWEIPVVRRGLNGDPITGPPVAGSVDETQRPKLKPLHWDKVRASSDRAMVWDQLKSSSFQLNEEMIETLFMVNASSSGPKDNSRRLIPPMPNQENRVLDPKKSQNIAILLRALNVTIDEVCEALLEGSADTLGTELLESLLKMAPTNEEERKLKEFKDESPFKLGPAEKFLKAVLDVPFAFKRVDAMLYIANFDSEVEYLKRSFETLEAACKELKDSRMFLKLLEAVLKTGNRMNVGTNRGDAQAFKLDTLLKLVDVKGADGKTTLLHFVVQEISRAEGFRVVNQSPTADKNQQYALQEDMEFTKLGLQVVSGLSRELTNVKKAAAMDSDMLSTDATKLSRGIGKVNEVLKFNEVALKESSQKFSGSMNEFLKKAEAEIVKIQAKETVALSLVKEITEYFHGNSAKEEAHPFRIFMVVRDFLSILDQVCKEVGKINERSIVSSARQFPLPVNSSLPPVFPGFNGRPRYGSSDDETSSP